MDARMPADYGMLQILSCGEAEESTIMPDIYAYEMPMTVTSVMSQDDFFVLLYGVEAAA